MSDTFNYERYNPADGGQLKEDASDAYANAGFVISFQNIIAGESRVIKFKAYITNFNESYNSDFAAEAVFGRADPIYAFRNTTRQIALTFQAPASSVGEAYENLAKAHQLVQFLYPAYAGSEPHALTIAQSPLTRLKIMNLIGNKNNVTFGAAGSSEQTLYSSYKSSDTPSNGLLGVITNMTIMHNIDNGEIGVFEKTNNTILPKMIEIQLSFSPIHEHTLGWLENGSFAEESFPYGASLGIVGEAVDGSAGPDDTPSVSSDPDQAEIDNANAETSSTVNLNPPSEGGTPANQQVLPMEDPLR